MTALYGEPYDYLVVGHLTRDLTPQGPRLGGTAAYAALTARALGLRVAVVTAWAQDLDPGPLREIPIAGLPAEVTTTFTNEETPQGRVQVLHAVAPSLDITAIPPDWRRTRILHLAPVAQEVAPTILHGVRAEMVGVTPQGWLREWDSGGRVRAGEWPEARFVLGNASAAVFSLEDIGGDESRIEELIHACPVIVVTEGAEGARVYWHSDVRRFRPPPVEVVDTTGAGDIFAAAFFIRLHHTRDPCEAARFATPLAALSVTRRGLAGIPTRQEIESTVVEIF